MHKNLKVYSDFPVGPDYNIGTDTSIIWNVTARVGDGEVAWVIDLVDAGSRACSSYYSRGGRWNECSR